MSEPATRSGSVSGSRSAAPSSVSRSTRSAERDHNARTWTSSSTATPRPGTRRRCWPDSAQACLARLLRPRMPRLSHDRLSATLWTPAGPVLFAYDGSELAAFAIAQAAAQLAPRRDALVVCVWQPVDVGIHPDRQEALRRRPGHRGTACCRTDRRPRGIAGRGGRIPGLKQGR